PRKPMSPIQVEFESAHPSGPTAGSAAVPPPGAGSGNTEGAITVSLFDVSELTAPTMLDRVNFGGDWASLAEGQDRIHKAFNVLEDQNLILVPFAGTVRTESVPGVPSGRSHPASRRATSRDSRSRKRRRRDRRCRRVRARLRRGADDSDRRLTPRDPAAFGRILFAGRAVRAAPRQEASELFDGQHMHGHVHRGPPMPSVDATAERLRVPH